MNLEEVLAALNGLPAGERARLASEACARTSTMRWVPNPGPQTEAFFSEADELFYGGEAGGGKSDLVCGLAITEHNRSVIFREFRDDAQSLLERLKEVTQDTTGWNEQHLRYISPDGQHRVRFAGLPNEKDKQRWKGKPHDLIAFDEIGDFSESQYTMVIGWNRSAKAGQRCRIVATGNPPTRAKGLWVIKRWAAWLDPRHPSPAKDGELRWYTTGEAGEEVEVDGPGPHLIGGRQVRAKSRTFIRAQLKDNPDLIDSGYDATLDALPGELRAAYRDGRFDLGLKDAPNQVIPTMWILEAQKRWESGRPRGVPMCAISADCVAGGSDEMAMAPRWDGYFELVVIPGKEIPVNKQGSSIAAHVIANRRDDSLIIVDMGGGFGSGPYERLEENVGRERLVAYNGSKATTQRTKEGLLAFHNMRALVYWRLREALDPDQDGGSCIALPPDQKLTADLTAVTYEKVGTEIKLLEKNKVKALLGRSPDRGDAVVMSWFAGPKWMTHGAQWTAEQGNGRRRRQPGVNLGPRRAARRH